MFYAGGACIAATIFSCLQGWAVSNIPSVSLRCMMFFQSTFFVHPHIISVAVENATIAWRRVRAELSRVLCLDCPVILWVLFHYFVITGTILSISRVKWCNCRGLFLLTNSLGYYRNFFLELQILGGSEWMISSVYYLL